MVTNNLPEPASSFRTSTHHIRTLLGAATFCLLGLASGGPAFANDCEVNPFLAYDIAVKRGWSFYCNIATLNPPGSVLSATFLPLPPNRIGCDFRTGPPSIAPPRVDLKFFVWGGKAPDLKNDWWVKQYELVGGNYTLGTSSGTRVHGIMYLNRHNTHFRYRLSRLVLSKPGGDCSKAIDEAF